MSDIPAYMIIEKNKLQSGAAWLVFLEITLPDSTILRFVRDYENQTFEGDVYTAFPFELEPTKNSSGGRISTVTLKVSNVTKFIEPYIESLDITSGTTVKITIVNSDRLVEDHVELQLTYDVLNVHSTAQWVVFTLGAPNPLRQRFPLRKFSALHCSYEYNDVEDLDGPRCQYVGETIIGITLPSGNPVSIEATDHPFSTADVLKFDNDVGGTVELIGVSYTITKTNANNFTLDGTDGDNFTAWISGGKVGYSVCNRTLSNCRIRDNSPNFGGVPGIRSGTVRIS